MKKEIPNLTEGPIVKVLFKLAVPIVLANILFTAYQLVDTFWVGRLGAVAVAAVSLSFPLIFLMTSVGMGLAIAGSILVAQYKGKGDQQSLDYVSAQTFLMMFGLSIILAMIGYFTAEPLMILMGAEPKVIVDAVSYMQISFIGLVFMFMFFVFQSLMRGVGDVKTPMLIVLATVLLNLVLDPLFILGFKWIPAFGVKGAAISTVFTQMVSVVWGLFMLFSGKHGIHLKRANFKWDPSMIKRLFLLGFPSSIERSTRALSLMIMSFLVAGFGTMTIAAYGIGIRIFSFVVIPSVGFAMATSTLVGQNIGANKMERAEQTTNSALVVSFLLLTGVGLILFVTAGWIVEAFIPNDPLVVLEATHFIRIMALSFGFMGIQKTLNGLFSGSGNTKISMVLSVVSLWMFQFPLAYILSYHTPLSAEGIWWAFPIANVLSAILAFTWYKIGAWKKKNLLNEDEKLEFATIGQNKS